MTELLHCQLIELDWSSDTSIYPSRNWAMPRMSLWLNYRDWLTNEPSSQRP